jgi:hypothetical protein
MIDNTPLSGCHSDRATNLDLCLALMAIKLAVRVHLHATAAATQDIGLYGLIRRTGTHVPLQDFNQ